MLGSAAMGLHHKLCHTLGGTFNLPHADVHTVILPHAIAYNRDFAPDAMRARRHARSAPTTPRKASTIWPSASAPGPRWPRLGMPHEGLDRAADLAVQNQYPNPRPLERPAIRELLEHAYNGTRP